MHFKSLSIRKSRDTSKISGTIEGSPIKRCIFIALSKVYKNTYKKF